ncbi:MAG: DUF815 domain-containing protein [Pseudomonadota bacterium]
MTQRRETLERIADALERLAPEVLPPQDWLSAPAYAWDGEHVRPVTALDAFPLDTLRGIDELKSAFTANVERLATGAAAHDTLLWGARGMGKSALVRAAVADVQARDPKALGLIQISASALGNVPDLLVQLGEADRNFLLFVDDLGFGPEDKAKMLSVRSLLEGGVVPRPRRVRVVVTSNRRAIVQRDANETEALHERDARDDALALADRFGLTLGFHPCDRDTYLDILHAYTDPLGLEFHEDQALAWAVERGSRSGRTAFQYATELAGRAGMAI